MLPGVNTLPEVTVTEEKKWSYTREEETVLEHREEEYEDYEDYEEYKEYEEYEPTEEYDQYDEYAERELEHYEEAKEQEEYVVPGMAALQTTLNMLRTHYGRMAVEGKELCQFVSSLLEEENSSINLKAVVRYPQGTQHQIFDTDCFSKKDKAVFPLTKMRCVPEELRIWAPPVL